MMYQSSNLPDIYEGIGLRKAPTYSNTIGLKKELKHNWLSLITKAVFIGSLSF